MPVYRLIMLSAPLILRPIDPARPAGPQIFDVLRGAILRMDFVPGQVLSEADLGTVLGASRTPVREALMRLRELGLVETRPSRGTYVTPLDAARIREAQFLREALEVANVLRLTQADLPDTVDANLQAQADAIACADDMTFQALDDAFHRLLAEATGLNRPAVVLMQEKAQLDRLRVLSLRDGRRLSVLLDEHRAITQAIRSGDARTAEATMRAHLRSVLDVLDDLAARHSDYFTRGRRR